MARRSHGGSGGGWSSGQAAGGYGHTGGNAAHNPFEVKLPKFLYWLEMNEDNMEENSVIMVDDRDARMVSPFQGWLTKEIMSNSASSINVLTERDQVMPPNSGFHLTLFGNYTLDGIKVVVVVALDTETGCMNAGWDQPTAEALSHPAFQPFAWPLLRDTSASYTDVKIYNGNEAGSSAIDGLGILSAVGGPVAAKIPGGSGRGMDRSMAAFFALPLFSESFARALCKLGLGKCEFWLALDEGEEADEQIARLVSVMDGEQSDRDEVLANLDAVQILHGMVTMARTKVMAEIANDLGYGEAACSDPGRAGGPVPKAGAPDPGVPSFKKPKVTAANGEVSSLKDEEEREKIKWAARLKLIADKAGSAAQINSSMGGDLSPEEQSEIKSLVFRSGAFRTIRLHVLAWERMEKWAVDHGLSIYPPSTQVVTKYFLALQDSGCGPAVLPGLRQAIRWICKRLVMTPPDAGDPALEAIVAKVYEERGKELKEAVPVPLKAVAALEYLVNALILAGKIPAAIFVWWILILIYASLRWDDGRHVAPSSLTLTGDALVGLVWQTKVERRRKGTRFAVPMCSLAGVTWLEEGWHVFQRFKNDRDFFIWDLVDEGQFDVVPISSERGLPWLRYFLDQALTIALEDHVIDAVDTDFVRAQCAKVTCHSLRVTLLDAAVHAGADDKVIGLQANWKDPSQLVLKYARSRKELSVRMVQDLATVIRESWTPDQESFVVEDEPEGLKSELCVAAADAGLLSVEVFAMLGDTAAAAKTALKAIVPEHALGATGGERELGVMQLASVWLACQALQTQFATRRARMEEDPNKIPEMAQEDHAEFRARFVRSHPDVILIDAKEPHKKFVEKLNRDYLVNGMVPFYTMAEVRTRADNIVQKAGLTKNAEDLLTVAKAEEPDSVTDVNTLMNRIHAFFMALEYLNICQYSRGAGPLRYIQELEQFRTECPSLPFLQLADSLIRKKVYRLQAEQREVYSTYQLALQEVLTNHKYLWNDARTKAQLARSEHAKTVDTTDTSDRVQFDTPVKLAKKNKKKRKLERLQEQITPNQFVLEAVDLTDSRVLEHLESLIREGRINYIHFGTPCSSFSLARKDDGGPPPLRARRALWGLPNLTARDQDKVRVGNKLMQLTVDLANLAHTAGAFWSIENPLGSYLWAMPPVQRLAKFTNVSRTELDMCRFGSAHLKPTALLGNASLQVLGKRCDRDRRPHVHDPLVGFAVVDGGRVFKTRLAQVYPWQLCDEWAQLIVGEKSDPLSATFAMKVPAAHRKRPVGQPLPWKDHRQRDTGERAIAAGYQLKKSAVPPLLPCEFEPGEAVRFALNLDHPFSISPDLEPDLQEALSFVAHQPDRLLAHRLKAKAHWEARAVALLPVTEQILASVQDPWLRMLLRGAPDEEPLSIGSVTHIALWREMAHEARSIDAALVDEMLTGMTIVGPISAAGRWPAFDKDQRNLSQVQLQQRAWEFSRKVTNNVAKCEVTENTQKVWDATIEDVKDGVTLGPFFDKKAVSAIVGDPWIPTQRFEVVQKNKVRGVDSATINGVNQATVITDKLVLPSTDVNVAALRWLRSRVHGEGLHGWVLDERKAYRQVPVHPDHRRWSVITMKEPSSGKIAYFVMIGHSFGLVTRLGKIFAR
eukprot:g3708.t1